MHTRGLFWDAISVESSGGANPLSIDGVSKSQARYFVEHVRERMNDSIPTHAALNPSAPAIAGAEEGYAAAATAAPLKTRPCLPAEIVTFSPSLILPERMSSASGSCTDFWITRLSGRAP